MAGEMQLPILVFGDAVTDVQASVANGGRQLYPLGTLRFEDGKGYRYVKYDNGTGNLASVAGNIAFQKAAGNFEVTMDVSDTDVALAAGAFKAVIADAGFGWIQTSGPCTLNTAGGDAIVAGDALIPTSADGVIERWTVTTIDPTEAQLRILADGRIVGKALAADDDGANTVLAFLEMI